MKKENLQQLVSERLGDYLFIVVSNRQPYEHSFQKGEVTWHRSSGGLVTALDPVLQACRGLWIAMSSGDADRSVTDSNDKVAVPPDHPTYTLKRIFLTKEEEEGYYYGFSNESLWPLCHMAFKRPVFRQSDWDHYVKVNEKFAQAIIEEIGDRKAFVWIQDYHLCLLPKLLKEKIPQQVIVSHFWHIPWPNYETFRICPQKQQLLDGLLANDLICFHIHYHCNNFIDIIDRLIESKIDRERFSVVRGGHETLIRPQPISVDFEAISRESDSSAVAHARKQLVSEFGLEGRRVLVGIDRIDYTKGIPERLLAMDRLLEKHPELKEKVVFLHKGVVSRIHLAQYKDLNEEIDALVEKINWKHSTDHWKPILMVRRHMTYQEILALYRLCDVCIVSSLHDGMNLVAKEFVATRSDDQGVLVLSQFTGSARELTDAVLVNPFDGEQFSDALYQALCCPQDEQQRRMSKMRKTVKEQNIFRWAGKIISDLLRFEFKE